MSAKTVSEWAAHWNAKAGIANPMELNGYCVGGVPIPAERYMEAVVRPLLERLELEPQHCVLDIGCGSGMTLLEIERRVAEAVGTDISQAMVDRYPGKAKTYVCAAHQLPFDGVRFDRILMFSVAHYFPDFGYFRGVVENCLSLLRKGGILLVGDLPLGKTPAGSAYLWYERQALAELCDELGHPYSIAAQNRAKRAINRRYDLILYKD